jgi:AraC family transcriptional regulator of adaptative response/methylated-DNA-[protein]-cysteine methyltransferase
MIHRIDYATTETSIGTVLVAATARGVCRIALGDGEADLVATLARELPYAVLAHDAARIAPYCAAVADWVEQRSGALDLPLDVRASAFRRRVWDALAAIPRGETRSYADVARAIGAPSAARAVAGACAANPVALVIPCHRVVASEGGLGGYRWGVARKRALLERESRGEAGTCRGETSHTTADVAAPV